MTLGLATATIFSLSSDPPVAIAQEPSSHAEMDAACLIGDDAPIACRVQRLSAAGATLRVDAQIDEDDRFELQLANGQRLAGAIGWAELGAVGFVFDTAIDVIGTIARNLATQSDERRRVPRVEINQTVCVRRGELVEFTRARNVSQGGVGIETRLALVPGDKIHFTFDGLRPLDGEVVWARDNQAGIAFGEQLGWQTLMPWLRQLQQLHANSPLAFHGAGQEALIPEKHAIRIDAPARVREGVRWWNVTVRALTAHLVEFDARAPFKPGTQVWVSLPGIGGAPANVIEARQSRYLCEFRLPLSPREMRLLGGPRE